MCENKNNDFNFDFKDIKIYNQSNNFISIKDTNYLEDNFNILKTNPDGNCFFEAFLKSANV
jgi:hypothetical protein